MPRHRKIPCTDCGQPFTRTGDDVYRRQCKACKDYRSAHHGQPQPQQQQQEEEEEEQAASPPPADVAAAVPLPPPSPQPVQVAAASAAVAASAAEPAAAATTVPAAAAAAAALGGIAAEAEARVLPSAALSSIPPLRIDAAPLQGLEKVPLLEQLPRTGGMALLRYFPNAGTQAWAISQHYSTSLKKKMPHEPIAGKVMQYALGQLPPADFDRASFEKLVRDTAEALGVPDVDQMFVVSPKLLVAKTGLGLQVPHWDQTTGAESKGTYTFVLYCSNTYSTAMPRFHPAHIRKESPDLALLQREWYHSVQVLSGDILFFDQSIPHFGVQNDSALDRLVVFAMLSPSDNEEQDDYQLFRWTRIGEVAGFNSRTYAQALVDDKDQNPLGRYEDESEYNAAVEMLRHFGLFDAYFEGREPRWVPLKPKK